MAKNDEIEKDEELFEDDDLDVKKVKKKIDFEDDDDDDEIDDSDFHEIPLEDRVENIEKKMTIVMILLVITLLFSAVNTIIAISSNGGSKSSGTVDVGSSEEEYTYDTSAFKEISASDIESESKSETIVVWIGRQGCYYCTQYAPNIKKAGEDYGIKIRYLDLLEIFELGSDGYYVSDEKAYNTLINLTGNGEWATFAKDNLGATPLTLIIKNNKVVGGLEQAEDVESIEEAFEKAGITK